MQRKRRKKKRFGVFLFLLVVCIGIGIMFVPWAMQPENFREVKNKINGFLYKEDFPDSYNAKSLILVDCSDDEIFVSKNENEPQIPASLAKLFVIEYASTLADLDSIVVADYGAISLTKPGSSVAQIKEKEYFLHNLFAAMLVPSGNDAAYVVADYCGGLLSPQAESCQERVRIFMENLNLHLQQQGYLDTVLYDPSGFDMEALTTTLDLKEVVYRLLEYSWFREIVSQNTYTARLGILTREDEEKVEEAMKAVHAEALGSRDFNNISDGQRQRVLLARAICQEPDIIILDEPTSFLDIKHKLDLLSILRDMAKKKQITVIMSLHEIDLAQKIADKIICVKGDTISHFGKPEEIFEENMIRELYEINNGFFDPLFGSIELPKPEGEAKTFVICGNGTGIPVFRQLQKVHTPFIAGVLYTNDVDYRLARLLADQVITEKPFMEISGETFQKALKAMESCDRVICTSVPVGSCNKRLGELIEAAKKSRKVQFV